MDWVEATGVVWETLAKAQAPQTVDQIADTTGYEASQLRKALAALREARLIGQSTARPASYHAICELDALRWAKGIDVGIPLSVLEAHGRLAAAGRAEALRLAASGKIEAMDQERMTLRRQEREQLLAGRAASRAAATDLGRLVEDTRAAAKSARSEKAAATPLRQKAVQVLLDKAASEAERALNTLLESLR